MHILEGLGNLLKNNIQYVCISIITFILLHKHVCFCRASRCCRFRSPHWALPTSRTLQPRPTLRMSMQPGPCSGLCRLCIWDIQGCRVFLLRIENITAVFRFKNLSKNIRGRRGSKVAINVPIFKDKNTKSPYIVSP